jgi:hypothetical protein
VYVVWVYGDTIFLKISKDNGASFNDAINLNTNADLAFSRPRIAVSGSNVYVVWVDSKDIFFRASKDNGASFNDAINLSADSKNATASKRSDLPDIAISDNNVYVVWVDYTPGNYDIFFRASKDNGSSFSNAVELSTIAALSDLPHIAASGSNVYVVWDDYNLAEGLDIFLRASTDNGSSFGNAINLGRNTGYSISTPIAVSGSNVYVVSSIGNIDIFLKTSKDNGANFGNAVNLSSNQGGSSDPNIAVSGSNVYVVWEDYADGNAEVFFTALEGSSAEVAGVMVLSTDNGSTKVEMIIDRDILAPEQPIKFTLKFLNPITAEMLQHVNYSFMIMDENQNVVVNKPDMHVPEGVDTQSITFSNTGSFTLVIDVAGLGINQPYDTSHRGMASTTLTVVPEFPVAITLVLSTIFTFLLVFYRMKSGSIYA